MRRYYVAARRAVGTDYYRPAAMLLALVFLLVWQGVAQADVFNPAALDAAQVPDAVHGPGADRVPPGLSCTDEMDFAPENNLRNPLDADSVAWRLLLDRAYAQRAATDRGCLNDKPRVNRV